MSNRHYSLLLREHIGGTGSSSGDTSGEGTRKKRKIRSRTTSVEPELLNLNQELLQIGYEEDDSELESDEFEDVSVGDETEDREKEVASSKIREDNSNEEEEEEEEDYSFLSKSDFKESDSEERLTINITQQEPPKPPKRKVNFISKEERHYRVMMHQGLILAMICHGVIRNRWCSDYELLVSLRETLNPDILDELKSIRNNKRMSVVNAVRFTDVVRELMYAYSRKFKVTRQGIVRKNWNELQIPQNNIEKDVTFTKFKKLCLSFQGSKDVGAQSFVALARSLGMKARLVYSIQPPDFTMTAELPKAEFKVKENQSLLNPDRKSLNAKQAFLMTSRSNKRPELETDYKFPSSSYPIFWVEIWNKFNRKWLAVDPFTLRIVEQPPMRRKSSFEPPMSDPTNSLLYAIAFDSRGKVKDVTRRYAQQFNAKTVKKRISNKSEEYADWYDKVINACSTNAAEPLSKVDILELKEFRDRDLAEGMPNNAAGFEDHPMYALESQLRQNEIINPMDSTTKCGSFRYKVSSRSKTSTLVPVYKRSAVHILRSAKAWYLRGRVLKVGEQPLKVKVVKKKSNSLDSDDESDDGDSQRLYAEFQTKLHIPPPLELGLIPKNAYGNIDAYVPTMIPEGGYLVEITPSHSLKLMEKAARILEIDYARAIVAFDFGKNGRKAGSRIPKAREGGIVIHQDFEDAMKLVMDQLEEEEKHQQRKQMEILALRSWKFFLTRLRIKSRLDRQHGLVPDFSSKKRNSLESDSEESSSGFSVYSESEGDEPYEAGGFVPTDIQVEPGSPMTEKEQNEVVSTSSRAGTREDDIEDEAEDSYDKAGGFLTEEDDESAGGFLADTNSDAGYLRQQHKSEPLDSELLDIPQDDFIVQPDGELIYNPKIGTSEPSPPKPPQKLINQPNQITNLIDHTTSTNSTNANKTNSSYRSDHTSGGFINQLHHAEAQFQDPQAQPRPRDSEASPDRSRSDQEGAFVGPELSPPSGPSQASATGDDELLDYQFEYSDEE